MRVISETASAGRNIEMLPPRHGPRDRSRTIHRLGYYKANGFYANYTVRSNLAVLADHARNWHHSSDLYPDPLYH